MKPFNLELAKEGKPVCTRDGRKARIICFDYHNKNLSQYPVIALVQEKNGSENIQAFSTEGGFDDDYSESPNDLVMCDLTLNPFDKVLVRDDEAGKWRCSLFSNMTEDSKFPFMAVDTHYAQCIPYNEETAHLLNTCNKPPQNYVRW